jgi:hypothetical protein
MKRLVITALAALSLAACASTPTVYQPAGGPSAVGYSEYRIEPGRYRVMFRGGSGASERQVMDFALMRAADLAIAEGYDWFRVSDRSMSYAAGGGGPRFSVGVGGGSWGSSSGVGMGVGTTFGDDGYGYGSGAPTASLEVFMGRGPKPAGVDVYDARAVRSTLGGPAPS